MILFHFPPFLIDRDDLVSIQGQITSAIGRKYTDCIYLRRPTAKVLCAMT